jgi:hypothetical protein
MALATIPAPPLPGGDVSLVTPDREMLRARVDEIDEGGVDLALLQSSATPDHRSTSYVEFVCAEGLWRYVGRHAPLDRSPRTDPSGVCQLVRFTYSGPPQLMQRREFIRTAHVTPVNLFDLGDPDAVAEAGSGLLVRGLETIAAGDHLHVELALEPGGPRIAAECRAVRVTAEGHHGVRFTRIADIDRDQLVEFAYARERARRELEIAR